MMLLVIPATASTADASVAPVPCTESHFGGVSGHDAPEMVTLTVNTARGLEPQPQRWHHPTGSVCPL